MDYKDSDKISKKEIKKQNLVAVALDFFIENGIEEAKVNDIALTANLNERTAFRYFENKAQLVFDATILLWTRIRQKVIDDFDLNCDKSILGIDKLEFIVKSYLNLFYTSKKELLFMNEAEIYLSRNKLMFANINTPKDSYINSNGPLALAIKEGVKDGSIKNDKSLNYLYYNTYDAILGILEKMALNMIGESNFDISRRLSLFANTITDMYRNNESSR